VEAFDEKPSFNRMRFTVVCASTDIDVPEKMPKATETKNKCFIRKIGGLHVSTT
jgi:hypothetical protein